MYTPQEFRDKANAAERDFTGNLRFLFLSGAVTGGLYYFDMPGVGIWGIAVSLIAAVVAFSTSLAATVWDAAAYLAFFHSEVDKKRSADDAEWFSYIEQKISGKP